MTLQARKPLDRAASLNFEVMFDDYFLSCFLTLHLYRYEGNVGRQEIATVGKDPDFIQKMLKTLFTLGELGS